MVGRPSSRSARSTRRSRPGYWLSFVRSGDPNAHKLARVPVWPTYMPARRLRIALQEGASTDVSGSTIETEMQPESSQCAFGVASKAAHQQA